VSKGLRSTVLAFALVIGGISVARCGGGDSSALPAPSAPSTPSPSESSSVPAPTIVLGRPTDASIAASVLGTQGTQVYMEYGTSPGAYTGTTAPAMLPSTPLIVSAIGLSANTRYYYRIRYRGPSEQAFHTDAERSFQTQLLSGSTFTFVVQADPHLDSNSSAAVYRQTLLNELADQPDFMFDLGDTSMSEKCAIDGSDLCATPSPPSADTVWHATP
jgi:hypothetical protein